MNTHTEEPPDWTDREYGLYLSLSRAVSHDKRVASLLEEWRDLWAEELKKVSADAYQLTQTRDALVKKILVMFHAAREHDAEFLEPHGHDMIHLVTEGAIYPEKLKYSYVES